MTPYLQDADVTLYVGDALEVLRSLPDQSVHMCATSPPFYGLRDYGVEGQIGLEETPDEWVARLVEVFREVRRVLRDDGTLWVEIGDSYATAGGGTGSPSKSEKRWGYVGRSSMPGYKQKDLLGQPWLLAFALRADGWYLRSEIIWARPNAMPESVTDRPTKSHSTIFLLSKRPRYFFDAEAIREPHQHDGRKVTHVEKGEGSIQHRNGERWPGTGANARSVWWQATEPTPWAHFATWPSKLVQRMILAGTSERGVCKLCGAPYVRDNVAHPEAMPEVSADTSAGGIREGFDSQERPPSVVPGMRGCEAPRELAAESGTRAGTSTALSGDTPRADGRAKEAVSSWRGEGSDAGSEPPLLEDRAWKGGEARRTASLGEDGEGTSLGTTPSGSATRSPDGGSGFIHGSGLGRDSDEAEQPVSLLPTYLRNGSATDDGSRRSSEQGWSSQPGEHRGSLPSVQLAQARSRWRASCSCDAAVVPATILDPFAGSGTTLLVARKLGRRAVGIELNESYCALVRERTQQQSLFAGEVA